MEMDGSFNVGYYNFTKKSQVKFFRRKLLIYFESYGIFLGVKNDITMDFLINYYKTSGQLGSY